MSRPRLTVPTEEDAARFADLDADVDVWDFRTPAPGGAPIDLALRPYLAGDLRHLDGERVRAVQAQSLGYDDAVGRVPEGVVWCNAVGVHEGPTAEIAVGLLIAGRRGFAQAARAVPDERRREGRRRWGIGPSRPGVLGSRILLLGHGGIGREIATRLDGFGAELVIVAHTAREEDGRTVHGADELAGLLPTVDAVVVAVPYGPATHHLLDEAFLSALPDGALVVNVARGKVADTDALVDHARRGRIELALDVVDPEPLPDDHPLWTLPNVLLTPHVGGDVSTRMDRVDPLFRAQVARLRAGEPLACQVDVSPR